MKSLLIAANLILTVATLLAGFIAASAQRTAADSTYSWLKKEGVVRESPDFDVNATLRNASGTGVTEAIGAIGAAACLANAVAIAIFWPNPTSSPHRTV